MLKGLIKVVDNKQMNFIHEGVMNVLENTGLQIQSKIFLKVLADAGCKVDFEKKRVLFKRELVEEQIEKQRDRYKMVRSSLWYPFCKQMPKDDVAWPDEFTVDYGFGAPSMYDYLTGKYRNPTVQDQIDMIKLGNAIDAVKAVNSPFICSEFDSRMETMESSRLLLLNTKKPGWVGTSSAKEVKYLADFSDLALDHDKEQFKTQPPIFIHAYCTTSPLKIDNRSCEVLEEALKYKFPVNFAPMPILGGTTPVTPAGSAVIATAEILGGITAASLIAPDLFYFATSISGEMDMKTTQVCYSAPAAILTDALLHQLFRYKYGLVLNIEPGYIEAKCPGIQATFMKMFRSMTFGSTVSLPLPLGLLDNGSVFSPAQAMIDLDIAVAQYKFACGIEFNEETIGLDLINEMKFCEREVYLQTEHTYNNFRNVLWDTKYFDRHYREMRDYKPEEEDRKMLHKADAEWKELVASQKPIEREQKFKDELDKIIEAAKKELLNV